MTVSKFWSVMLGGKNVCVCVCVYVYIYLTNISLMFYKAYSTYVLCYILFKRKGGIYYMSSK